MRRETNTGQRVGVEACVCVCVGWGGEGGGLWRQKSEGRFVARQIDLVATQVLAES